jgi:hypothetical protein
MLNQVKGGIPKGRWRRFFSGVGVGVHRASLLPKFLEAWLSNNPIIYLTELTLGPVARGCMNLCYRPRVKHLLGAWCAQPHFHILVSWCSLPGIFWFYRLKKASIQAGIEIKMYVLRELRDSSSGLPGEVVLVSWHFSSTASGIIPSSSRIML